MPIAVSNPKFRSGTPLIYRAIPVWFIRVQPIVEQLVANNNGTRWFGVFAPFPGPLNLTNRDRVPSFVGEGRFGNWLANARDWNVSRNRYWGTPIPLWVSEDMQEVTSVNDLNDMF